MVSPRHPRLIAFAGSLLSAIGFWLGTGLQPLWGFTWIAPLPLLLVAQKASWRTAALCSFIGYALGSLNTWSYLNLLPLGIHLLLIALPALAFALCVLAYRHFLVRGSVWWGLLSFPSLWTVYTYVTYLLSPHGTFGALTYSQANCLPVLQLAAVGGIWPIEFFLFMVPGAIAFLVGGAALPHEKVRVAVSVGSASVLVLSYGFIRLHQATGSLPLSIGLIASDLPENMRAEQTLLVLQRYIEQLPALVRSGAKVVVLPEHLVAMSEKGPDENAMVVDALLAKAAINHQIGIVLGVDRSDRAGIIRNEARYYSPLGSSAVTYTKHHLLPGFEDRFKAGTDLSMFTQENTRFGLAICKDLDFPRLSVDYAKLGLQCLIVPAFDFDADAWLHSRMAIVRGVESGYPIARVAKLGALTVSDNRGRVLSEVRSQSAPFAMLITEIPQNSERTLYSRLGDWFAWINTIIAGVVLAMLLRVVKTLKPDDYFKRLRVASLIFRE